MGQSANSPLTFRGGLTNNSASFTAAVVFTRLIATPGDCRNSFNTQCCSKWDNPDQQRDPDSWNFLSGTGGLTQGATGVLNLSGTSAITTINALAVGNIVNYNGAGAQNVHNNSYDNLVLSGGGAKTFTANTTINHDLTINSTATADLGVFGHTALSLHRDATLSATGIFGGTGCTTIGATIDPAYFAPATGVLYVNTCLPGTWTGASGTDWNNSGNWSCATIPTTTTDVTIPSGGNQPIIGAAAFCRTLLFNPELHLDLQVQAP